MLVSRTELEFDPFFLAGPRGKAKEIYGRQKKVDEKVCGLTDGFLALYTR